jgi:hypothetical protein
VREGNGTRPCHRASRRVLLTFAKARAGHSRHPQVATGVMLRGASTRQAGEHDEARRVDFVGTTGRIARLVAKNAKFAKKLR